MHDPPGSRNVRCRVLCASSPSNKIVRVSLPWATTPPPVCIITVASTLLSPMHRRLCCTISMHYMSTPGLHHADQAIIAGIERYHHCIPSIRDCLSSSKVVCPGLLASDRSIRSHTTYSSSNTLSLPASLFLPHLLCLLLNSGLQ